jgi:hypothetical protein
MHGFLYALETEVRATKWYKTKRKTANPTIRVFIERAIFFLPLCLSLAMFRSESVGAGFHLYSQMFGTAFDTPSAFNMRHPVMMLGFAFSIIYFCPNAVELMSKYRPAIMTYHNKSYGFAFLRGIWRPGKIAAVFIAVLVITSLYFVSRQPPFLYQGF